MINKNLSIYLFFKKLGSLVTEKDLDSGRVYPPVASIHEVTVKIAAHLVEHLYNKKKAWHYPGKIYIS
jgi:malate dehydrogenase (oxaloacetate-decarboxylating)(NADP+)